MRVIAGTCRSLPLITPEGIDTRPTTDRIKETLFNMIQTEIPGCVFYDLFSGSGGIGIEALSRGAKHAFFVENNKKALECIKKNLTFTKMADNATVVSRDILGAMPFLTQKADVIFMDPPYEMMIEASVMQLLKDSGCLTKDTLIIIEAKRDRDLSDIETLGYTLTKEKVYKTNKHVFFTPAQGEKL